VSAGSAYFCLWLSPSHDHSATGRIRLVEKSSYFIGNRTSFLPACSIAPQSTALPEFFSNIALITVVLNLFVRRICSVFLAVTYAKAVSCMDVLSRETTTEVVLKRPRDTNLGT
jgi:hypothetical protein